jgi:hypothetical protein
MTALWLTLLLAAGQELDELHKLVRPQPDEWKWARIPWMGDLAEARKKGAAEGKPLYVWTMAGEPLGQC